MSLLNFTILITVTAAGILLVKKLLGTKITPRGHMLLWLLICVQILAWPVVEWMPEADWALRQYVPQVTDTRIYTQDVPPDIDDGIPLNETAMRENTISITSLVYGTEMKTQVITTKVKADRRDMTVAGIWGMGSGMLMIIVAAGSMKQTRKLKGLPDCQDCEVLHVFSEVKRQMGLEKRRILLKTGSEATLLAGIWRPTVYLASDSDFTEAELRHVFAHELTHYKHRDLWINVISAGVLCAYWWNPMIWLAFRRFHLDMEVYCDYDASKVTGNRRAYAQTLVKAAAGRKGLLVAATSLAEEEHQVSRRVKTLAKFKQPKVWVSVLAVYVLLGVSAGLLVNPAIERPNLTNKDVEILHSHVKDSQGDEVSLNMDGKQQEFLRIVNGDWTNREIWKNIEEEKGDARDAVFAYYKNWAQPAVTIRFHSLADYLSSTYIPAENSVKLYAGDSDRGKIVLLEQKGGAQYISDDTALWDALMELISEHTVMRDAVFPAAAKDASWMYEDTLYQTDFSWDGASDRLRDWEMKLGNSERTELSKQEVLQYLEDPQFDYWVNLYPGAGGERIMGHPADEPDGEGHTVVIGVNVGSGYVYDDSELAYLLADTAKLEFLPDPSADWRVCEGSADYEEALAVFEAKYFSRHSQAELEYLQAVCEGTFRESDTSKVTDYTVEMVSEWENAVLFHWTKETTYYNDIMSRVEIWAGGNHDLRVNPDGSRTIWDEHSGYLLNDGEGWYYVHEIMGGYNTDLCVDEDGSLKAGLIKY